MECSQYQENDHNIDCLFLLNLIALFASIRGIPYYDIDEEVHLRLCDVDLQDTASKTTNHFRYCYNR